ncbi:hypothetical protein J6590_082688 [Homalodisca vitripennis]|nr:hypothetical protein J6590_082688 [Homalodisca vitripennis]
MHFSQTMIGKSVCKVKPDSFALNHHSHDLRRRWILVAFSSASNSAGVISNTSSSGTETEETRCDMSVHVAPCVVNHYGILSSSTPLDYKQRWNEMSYFASEKEQTTDAVSPAAPLIRFAAKRTFKMVFVLVHRSVAYCGCTIRRFSKNLADVNRLSLPTAVLRTLSATAVALSETLDAVARTFQIATVCLCPPQCRVLWLQLWLHYKRCCVTSNATDKIRCSKNLPDGNDCLRPPHCRGVCLQPQLQYQRCCVTSSGTDKARCSKNLPDGNDCLRPPHCRGVCLQPQLQYQRRCVTSSGTDKARCSKNLPDGNSCLRPPPCRVLCLRPQLQYQRRCSKNLPDGNSCLRHLIVAESVCDHSCSIIYAVARTFQMAMIAYGHRIVAYSVCDYSCSIIYTTARTCQMATVVYGHRIVAESVCDHTCSIRDAAARTFQMAMIAYGYRIVAESVCDHSCSIRDAAARTFQMATVAYGHRLVAYSVCDYSCSIIYAAARTCQMATVVYGHRIVAYSVCDRGCTIRDAVSLAAVLIRLAAARTCQMATVCLRPPQCRVRLWVIVTMMYDRPPPTLMER